MKKIICYLFGHKIGEHYHRPSDVVACNGGCNPIINWDTGKKEDHKCLRCNKIC